MNNTSALVTVAMLTTFLSKEHKDYLDLITPFVLKVLPKKIDKKIDLHSLMLEMKQEFGFEDLPMNVIKRILDRLCKPKIAYLRKENKEYYLKKIYNSSTFELNQETITKSIEDVMNNLKNYYDERTFKKNVTIERVRKDFINFMDYYGYSVIANLDALKKLTKNDHSNYHVARFIIEEHGKNSDVFKSIREIVKGFFVYKSIYFFSTDQKKTLDSKLKKTEVYLDTRLIINALGYHLREDKTATNELLKLITESGGLLRSFNHTIDEVAGILTKYARDPLSRPTMHLDYFDRNAYEEVDIIRLRGALSINLKKIHVEIVETPCQNVSTEENLEDRGFIDEVQLKKHIEQSYQQFGRGKPPKDDSLDRDIASISAISRLRGRPRNVGIESCKAILATHNQVITKSVNEFFKERLSKGEISFVINELDLTALLWLRSFDRKSDLPTMKLLENAYSAIKPSNEILETFNEKVKMLEKEGVLTQQEALLIRTQNVIRQDLADLSQNDPDRIDSKMIIQIKNNLIESLTIEKDINIEALMQEINEEKRKKGRAIEEAESLCINESEKYYKKAKGVSFFILSLLVIAGISLFAYQYMVDKDTYFNSLCALFFSFVGIIGFVDLIKGRTKRMDAFLTKLKQRKFDTLYGTEINKIEKYFN